MIASVGLKHFTKRDCLGGVHSLSAERLPRWGQAKKQHKSTNLIGFIFYIHCVNVKQWQIFLIYVNFLHLFYWFFYIAKFEILRQNLP